MPIVASELKYFESTDGLGGTLVPIEIVDNILHNLFDVVTSPEALAGDINYRCIYVKNSNLTLTLANTVVFIQANTPATDSDIEIGLGTSAIDGTEQTIVDENTAPVSVIFTGAVGAGFGVDVGDMPPDTTKAIWIKRIINANASSVSNDSAIIAIQGDTA